MVNANFNRGLFLCTASVLFNSVATTISKFAMQDNNPMFTTILICLISTMLSYIYLKLRSHQFTVSEFQRLLPIAIFNSIATILLYCAIANLNPITVGFVGRSYVIFTILLSTMALKERIAWQEIALICVTISGIFLFADTKAAESTDSHWLGVTQVLVYTLLFALVSLFVKKNVHASSSVTILFFNNLFATILSFLFLVVNDDVQTVIANTTHANLYYAFLTAIMTFFGLVFFFSSFRFITFKLSNIIRSTSPLFVTIVSWPFFPIKLTLATASGGAMILMSVIALSIIEKRRL